MNDGERDLIALASLGDLSCRQIGVLYDGYEKITPDFQKHENFLIKSVGDGVYNKIRERFGSPEYRDRLFGMLKARGISCVTRLSENYPERLKHVFNPPAVLFCRGNLSLLKDRAFAVVGSRRTLPNIAKLCSETAEELTRAFTVVTGIADGGDAAAIGGALKSGKLISALAYGFDHAYPAVNANLIERVAERGLLVTEYMPQIPPVKYNFPERNRIIAGLSEGVLVVSAAQKSGALGTAAHALEAGREVYAFPYTPGVVSGEGCNALIKEGAKLATGAKDILEDFGFGYEPSKKRELSGDEARIYAYLKENGAAYAQTLSEELSIPVFKIIPLLSRLEMDNLAVRLGGNKYAAL